MQSKLCSAFRMYFCHLSSVELLSEIHVHMICEYKIMFGQKKVFWEVASKVLHGYTFYFWLSSCQWNILFISIL